MNLDISIKMFKAGNNQSNVDKDDFVNSFMRIF